MQTRALRRLRLPFGAVQAGLSPFAPTIGRRTLLLVLVGVGSALAETLALVLVARTAVDVAGGDVPADLPVLGDTDASRALAIAALALVARLALATASAWSAARLSVKIVRTARLLLLRDYLLADWSTQSGDRVGELQDDMTTSVAYLSGLSQAYVNGLTAVIGFSVIALAALVVNPLAAVGCVVASGAILLLLLPMSRVTKRWSWMQREALQTLAGDVAEAVDLTQEVRAFGVRDAVLRRQDVAEDKIGRPLLLGSFTATLSPAVYQTLVLALLVLAVGAVALAGEDAVPSLGAAVLLLLRSLGYGQQLQTAIQQLARALPFLDGLHERRRTYRENAAPPGSLPLAGVGDIELSAVSFSYEVGRPVLEDLSVRFGGAEAIGVVGPSGSGKSTLLQLLLRMRRPTQGALLVDGVDLWDVREDHWAARVAFVPQDARLLAGSVADNIRFFRDLTDEDVERAARLAHVHDDIVGWSDGYATVVGGSGGGRLSGGQRQRIAIARALAGRPDLLVLDEPTSALDLLSEARLQETLRGLAGRVGLVVVAHRLSTLSQCSRVLVLADGRCEGFDTHERLLASSAFYREAVRLSLLPSEPSAGSVSRPDATSG